MCILGSNNYTAVDEMDYILDEFTGGNEALKIFLIKFARAYLKNKGFDSS